ncbi:MAG TPA: UvrB/UvrC motif-containing protein, partial [Bacteroidia bacterium]|nr:UvrB/UvrC motif-containing protein [Bacteroidia bacterium]
SMKKTMDETDRRRKKQIQYNFEHNITPQQIVKSKDAMSAVLKMTRGSGRKENYYVESENVNDLLAAEPVLHYMTKEQLEKAIRNTRKAMEAAAKEMDFMEAARLRDEMQAMERMMNEKK